MIPSSLEFLEPRIAPAILLSPQSFSYIDIDGDDVRVTFSKPILTQANFDSIVNISGGLAGTGAQDLIGLDLFNLGPTVNGLNITITAKPSPDFGGDHVISGVYVDAANFDEMTQLITGIDLGKVNIDGDLTYIDAGDDNLNTLTIKSLSVKSVGLAEPGVASDFFGAVGPIKVTGNFAGDFFADSVGAFDFDFAKITIGRSILGNLGENAGRIAAAGGIGPVFVGGDIVGGSTDGTGTLRSATDITKVTINGSLIGSDGAETGRIRAFSIGPVLIKGSLIGGFGDRSGVIETFALDIASITINGSILGGLGEGAATISAGEGFDDDGRIGNILVKGSVIGVLPESGNPAAGLTIRADDSITKIKILGALVNANIVAGVDPGTDGEYATEDDTLTAGFPNALRRLGPVTILGGVSATMPGFGITASVIASIQAGGPVLKPGGPFADFTNGFLLGGGSGIAVIEI